MRQIMMVIAALLVSAVCTTSGEGKVDNSETRVLQNVFARAVDCADPTSKPAYQGRQAVVRFVPASIEGFAAGASSELLEFLVAGDALALATRANRVAVIDVLVFGAYQREPKLLFLLLQNPLPAAQELPTWPLDRVSPDEELRQLVADRKPWFTDGWGQQILWVAVTPEEAAQLFHLDQVAPSGATSLLIDESGTARSVDAADAVCAALPTTDHPGMAVEWRKYVTESTRKASGEPGTLAADAKRLSEATAKFAPVLGSVPVSTFPMLQRFWVEAMGGSRGVSENRRQKLEQDHGVLFRALLEAARGSPVIEAQVVKMMLGAGIAQFRELASDLESRVANREKNVSYVLLAMRRIVAKRIEGIRPSAQRDDWQRLLNRVDALYDESDRKPIFDSEMLELRKRRR